MPAVTLTPEDLAPFADIAPDKAAAMIADAIGQATLVAPCILEDTFEHDAAAKAVLRTAVLRWNEAGTGATTQLSALGFSQSVDTRQPRRGVFYPSEIDMLSKMCGGRDANAYTIDTAPASLVVHADTCALVFGASYCDCGAVYTGSYPLWESTP